MGGIGKAVAKWFVSYLDWVVFILSIIQHDIFYYYKQRYKKVVVCLFINNLNSCCLQVTFKITGQIKTVEHNF